MSGEDQTIEAQNEAQKIHPFVQRGICKNHFGKPQVDCENCVEKIKQECAKLVEETLDFIKPKLVGT